MTEHPIEGLMSTAMNSIKDMVDVNTIIGDPIQASDNTVIIPISKVSFGFAAGGSEFNGETMDEYNRKDEDEQIHYRLPFGGGAGAGVSINPTAFLVVQENFVKLLPVNHTNTVDKILDYVPDLIEKVNGTMNKCIQNKKNMEEEIIKTMRKKCNEKDSKTKENSQKYEDDEDEQDVETIEQEIKIEEEQE